MTGMTAARNRLEDDLPALLQAAHQLFAVALTALRTYEDPASMWFGRFVMAAASAADGRDAVIFAPSCQPTAPTPRRAPKRIHRWPLPIPSRGTSPACVA